LMKQDNLEDIIQDNLVLAQEIDVILDLISTTEKHTIPYTEGIQKCDSYISREPGFLTSVQQNTRSIVQYNAFINQEKKSLVEIDRSNLQGYILSKHNMGSTIDSKSNDKAHYAFTRTMLSDDAIKAFVVKKYLPVINKILNSYLQKFGSDVIFNFTPEFEEEIVSRHKETFSYESFSEGQKRRIDLAILFTFMEFCKIKFAQASTNLMILDEISAGLDVDGENILYEILKELASKEQKSIITISHSGVINPEYIDYKYLVAIQQGFSTIKRIT
jgi:DNA repair exonuclease SbcCD ATPase subunit